MMSPDKRSTVVKAKTAAKAPKPKAPVNAARAEEPVAITAQAPRQPVPISQSLSPMRDSRQEGRYVYGIIQAKDQLLFGKMGIGGTGEQVYTVAHGDISAVVSKTPVFIFDPTRENALAHEHVIETVMKQYTIIPMSFGTVFRTDDDIREVLRSIYPSLKDVLKQMEGKVEFGLKVMWERDHIIDELKREHEEIHRFHHEITRKHLQ